MSNKIKAYYEGQMSNIQRGIDHYRSRLKENLAERISLEGLLAKKEIELKAKQVEFETIPDAPTPTIMSEEENEAYTKRYLEDLMRRARGKEVS